MTFKLIEPDDAGKLSATPDKAAPPREPFKLVEADPATGEDVPDPSLWSRLWDVSDRLGRGIRGGLEGAVEGVKGESLTDIAKHPLRSAERVLVRSAVGTQVGLRKLSNPKGRDILKDIPEFPEVGTIKISNSRNDLIKKVAKTFIPRDRWNEDGTKTTRFEPIPAEQESMLDAMAKNMQKLRFFIPSILGQGGLESATRIVKDGKKVSETFLNQLPFPSPSSVAPKLVNAPKRAAEFSIDALTDVDGWLLGGLVKGASMGGKRLMQLPAVAGAYKKTAEAVWNSPLIKYFRTGGGGGTEFLKIKEESLLATARIERDAVEWGEKVAARTEGERKRIAQLMRSDSKQKLVTDKTILSAGSEGGMSVSIGRRVQLAPSPRIGSYTEEKVGDKLVRKFVPGDMSTRADLLEDAYRGQEILADMHNEAVKIGQMADTYTTKLTRKQLTTLRTRRAELEADIERLSTQGAFPAKHRLLALADNIAIQGDEALANRVRGMAGKFHASSEKRMDKAFRKVGAKLDEKSDQMGQVFQKLREKVNKLQTAITDRTVGDRALLTEELLDMKDELSSIGVKGTDAVLRKLVKTAMKPNAQDKLIVLVNLIETKGTGKVARRLEKTAIKFDNKSVGTANFTEFFQHIATAEKIPDKHKGQLLDLLQQVENVAGTQREKALKKMLDVADDAEQLGIKGLRPLVRAMSEVSGRFPGQKSLISGLEGKVDDITRRIHQHYVSGGRGYLPRMYEFFEKGYNKVLMEKGLTLKDLTNIEGDQLAMLNTMNRGQLDDFLNALSTVKKEGFGKRTAGIDRSAFASRQDVTDELRAALKEIHVADYPTVTKAVKTARAVQMTKLMNAIADNPKWAIASPGVTLDEIAQIPKSWKLLKGQGYGSLDGKWVDPDIARDLQHTAMLLGPWHENWLKALSMWKSGKVLYNPATHARNMLSNSIMMDLSGVDLLSQPRLLRFAAQQLSQKGAYYDEVKDTGLMLNAGFVDAELRTFQRGFDMVKEDPISQFMHASRTLTDELGNAYSSTEIHFKMAKYIDVRQKGGTPAQALSEAQKWLFDYSKRSRAVQDFANIPFGQPFVTWTSKALPRIAESFINNPMRLLKYEMAFDAIEDNAKEKFNLSDDDVKFIKKGFHGKGVILPVADSEGNPLVLDLSFWLPWGDITESAKDGKLPSIAGPGGPMMAFAEVFMNKSMFTQKQIYEKTEGFSQKFADTADYLAKALLPSLTPGIDIRESPIRGGYSYNKIVSAILKKPDRLGRVRSIGMVLSDTMLGLKAYPQDPNQLRLFTVLGSYAEINARSAKHRSMMRRQDMSDIAKARERSRYVNDIQRIMLKMRN